MKNRTLTRKHLENRYGQTVWPKALILREKHENDYYLINDLDALLRAAVEIVKNRTRDGWYYEPKMDEALEEVPDDVIDKLPEAMKKKALSDKQYNKGAQVRFEREKAQWDMIQKAVNEKDGVVAFQILDDRKDHQYEGWELEHLKVPNE